MTKLYGGKKSCLTPRPPTQYFVNGGEAALTLTPCTILTHTSKRSPVHTAEHKPQCKPNIPHSRFYQAHPYSSPEVDQTTGRRPVLVVLPIQTDPGALVQALQPMASPAKGDMGKSGEGHKAREPQVEVGGTVRGRGVQRGDPRVPPEYGRGQKVPVEKAETESSELGRSRSALGASASAGFFFVLFVHTRMRPY